LQGGRNGKIYKGKRGDGQKIEKMNKKTNKNNEKEVCCAERSFCYFIAQKKK